MCHLPLTQSGTVVFQLPPGRHPRTESPNIVYPLSHVTIAVVPSFTSSVSIEPYVGDSNGSQSVIYRRLFINAHVLSNLLNELGKRDKVRSLS